MVSPIRNTHDAREYLKEFHTRPDESFRQQRQEMLLKILDHPDSRLIGAMIEAWHTEGNLGFDMLDSLLHIIGYRATRGAVDAFEDIIWYFEARLLLGEQDEDENA